MSKYDLPTSCFKCLLSMKYSNIHKRNNGSSLRISSEGNNGERESLQNYTKNHTNINDNVRHYFFAFPSSNEIRHVTNYSKAIQIHLKKLEQSLEKLLITNKSFAIQHGEKPEIL